jgi:hypothetical protein
MSHVLESPCVARSTDALGSALGMREGHPAEWFGRATRQTRFHAPSPFFPEDRSDVARGPTHILCVVEHH